MAMVMVMVTTGEVGEEESLIIGVHMHNCRPTN